MRSAYLVLGIPGNATPEDIEAAFRHAQQVYPPQRLASEDGAVDKFNEIKQAYGVLRDPEARAAHDRKLAAAPKPRPMPRVEVVHVEETPVHKFVLWGLILMVVLFAGAFYVHQRSIEARAAQAALEAAEKQRAEREAREKKEEADRQERERAQARARQEADDRRFSMESQATAARASYERARADAAAAQAQRSAMYEQQRQESAARMQEERAAAEARLRVEKDKARIRQLCWQLYQRSDC
jgi:curved DNA-binding protein CbpA